VEDLEKRKLEMLKRLEEERKK